jgi:hypothetical protein
VTIRLKNPGSNPHVQLYATPLTENPHLVGQGSFKHGVFKTTFRIGIRTKLTAVWEGNDDYGPTQASTTLRAHARVYTVVENSYAKRHGWALMHVSKNPHVIARVSPLPGCLTYHAQRRSPSGRWVSYRPLKCVKDSVGVVLRGTHAKGERVRFRAVFKGDKYNLPAKGRWTKVLFTR